MNDKNRADFESWFRAGLGDPFWLTRDTEAYDDAGTESMWQAWQAARAKPERVALSDVEILEIAHDSGIRFPDDNPDSAIEDLFIDFAHAILAVQADHIEDKRGMVDGGQLIYLAQQAGFSTLDDAYIYARGVDITECTKRLVKLLRINHIGDVNKKVAQSIDAENVSKSEAKIDRSKWMQDVIAYLEGGVESEMMHESEGSIEARRLLAVAPPITQPLIAEAARDDEITDRTQIIMRLAHTYACATGSVARSCAKGKDPTDERKHQSKCYADLESAIDSAIAAVKRDDVEGDAKNAAVRFAGTVLSAHRNDGYPGDVDGADLQEMALKCGLIEARTVTDRCGEFCTCAEVATFPLECLFNTEAGCAAIAASTKGPR